MADFEKELHEGMEVPVEVFVQDAPGGDLNVQEHWHDCLEFQFVLEGKAEQIVNGKRYMTKEGDLTVILGGDIHATRGRRGQRIRILVLKFMPSLFERGSGGKKDGGAEKYGRYLYSFLSKREVVPELTQVQREYLDTLFCGIAREMEEKQDGYELMIKGEIFLLMGYLQREKILEPYRGGWQQEGPCDMERILHFMEENYEQDISLREVADSLHMNYSYTSRYFKKTTGRNFKEYLDFIRVSEANRLLAEGRKSITEISIRCGFNGPQAMNRVYGKVTGISPSGMRRLCQGIGAGKAM